MLSPERTSRPELSGGLLRMRALAAMNMMSSPLLRATIGSKIALPPISALPPYTASTAIAPCATVVQVTLRFSSVKKPLSRATTSGVKFATGMTASRSAAGAGGVCADAICGAITATAIASFKIVRISVIDRSPQVPFGSNSAAALVMPADKAGFDQQEHAVEHIAEDRQREDAGIHFRDFEGSLRQQDEVAQPVVRDDHLAE